MKSTLLIVMLCLFPLGLFPLGLCFPGLTAAAVAADGYPDIDGVARAIAAVAPADQVRVLGESREGRPIRSVLVGLRGERPLADRPRLLIVAGLNADRRVGTAVACALWERMKARAEEDVDLARRLSSHAIEIVPLANPDGLVALLAGPERRFATNTRPLDLDRDGFADENGPTDLDGDGRITWIRVPREGGTHGPSLEDPRLLVPAGAEAGIRGTFDLIPEGLDADGDGDVAEDGPGGVDLDRNFPHGWARTDPLTGRSSPSEPESRALADHLLANPRIACVLVFGARDNLVDVPPANRAEGHRRPTGPHANDLPWMKEAVARYRSRTGAGGSASDSPDGAFHQWVYAERGIPAFSTRVFFGPPAAGEGELPEGAPPPSEERRWLEWSDRELGGNGFTPWMPWEHPTLGVVEIGGFAPLLEINPPGSLLPEITDKHAAFVGDLLSLMPSPVLVGPKAKAVGRGLYEIRATVSNDGVFPLITAMGRQNRSPTPVRLKIDLPADRVLTGEPMVRIDRLDGYGGHRELVWIVRGKPNDLVKVRAVIDTWGTIEAEVVL